MGICECPTKATLKQVSEYKEAILQMNMNSCATKYSANIHNDNSKSITSLGVVLILIFSIGLVRLTAKGFGLSGSVTFTNSRVPYGWGHSQHFRSEQYDFYPGQPS